MRVRRKGIREVGLELEAYLANLGLNVMLRKLTKVTRFVLLIRYSMVDCIHTSR